MKKLYSLLLYFFPRTYREEYGDELQAVFNLSLADAMNGGWFEAVVVVTRELTGLPRAILYQHLRERRKAKMTGKYASRFDFEPGSRNEIFAALAPFLLFGVLPVLLGYLDTRGILPLWLAILFVFVFWSSGISLLVMGFKNKVPRWFMPYLGVPLPIISVITFGALVSPEWRGFPFLQESSWFVKQVVHQGMVWGGLFVSLLVIFLLTRLIPRSRSFHTRLQTDWTLLPFILYGAMPLVIVFSFEEFKNEEPYLLLSFLVLALGAWFYLRNITSWKKFWSLIIGLTLAMAVVVLGQTLLYESSFPFTSFPRWTTTLSTVIMWMWMVLYMFGSVGLGLLLPSNDHPKEA